MILFVVLMSIWMLIVSLFIFPPPPSVGALRSSAMVAPRCHRVRDLRWARWGLPLIPSVACLRGRLRRIFSSLSVEEDESAYLLVMLVPGDFAPRSQNFSPHIAARTSSSDARRRARSRKSKRHADRARSRSGRV